MTIRADCKAWALPRKRDVYSAQGDRAPVPRTRTGRKAHRGNANGPIEKIEVNGNLQLAMDSGPASMHIKENSDLDLFP